jgi:hypothetical protein
MILLILRIGLRSRGNHVTQCLGIVLLNGASMILTHGINCMDHETVVTTRETDQRAVYPDIHAHLNFHVKTHPWT